MSSKQVFKGAFVLTLSQIVIAISTFARNIIVARLISVEDYGIATTFAITLAMVEMASNFAFEKILVQDEKGGDADMLASAHFMHFIKSLATGLVLLMVAPLMAKLFGLRELSWAFQLLALIPVLKGLSHFDTAVYQRHMRFVPTAITDAIPQVLTVLIAYPLGVWFGDYRVMLFVVLLQPAAYTVLSHVYAERPYRWLINRELIKKKLNFAWPLLINGLLMFAFFNGDKAIIGHSYSVETLGWYSVAFALTMMPMILFSRICETILLPVLSKGLREDGPGFGTSCSQAIAFCTAIATLTVLVFIVSGSAIIYVCYGERYMEGAQVIVLLAFMQAVRIIRIAPTIIAISYSDTKNTMYSNIVRVLVIPVAVYLGLNNYSIVWIAVCGAIGEVLALIFSTYLLKLGNDTSRYLRSAFFNLMIFAVLAIVTYAFTSPLNVLSVNLFELLLKVFLGVLMGFIGLGLHLVLDKDLKLLVFRRKVNRQP